MPACPNCHDTGIEPLIGDSTACHRCGHLSAAERARRMVLWHVGNEVGYPAWALERLGFLVENRAVTTDEADDIRKRAGAYRQLRLL